MVMPSPEPNKEMDELLRAYAKKRRGQTPPELHPASRKMLQETVRQTFRSPPQTRAGGLALHWMGVALGGGVALILVIVLTVHRPPGVVPQAPTAASAPASAAALLKYSAPRGALRNAAQQFVQVNSQAMSGNEPARGATVLASFQMEREGGRVFVFDGDGSIYRGKVLKPPLFGKPGAGTNYSFEVSGVNNALRTNVVFTGNVLEMPPAAPQSTAAFGAGAATAVTAGSLKLNTQNPNQAQQFPRIMGKVKVGGGEYNIEAQPPGP
jgi:hypothetical protein